MDLDIEQIRQKAQDENTSPLTLASLAANSGDRLTRQYVALNPNTPVDTLERLGGALPDEITANPIFDLLLLENPGSKFILLSLARSSTTSEEKLNELANNKDREIREAVAKNKKTTLNILEKLATQKHQDRDILEAITKNPNTSANILDKMFDNNQYGLSSELLLENIKTSDTTLEKILRKHSYSYNKDIHQLIIKHPNASQVTIEISKLMNGDRDTPHHILEKLANDLNPKVRYIIAWDFNTSPDILSILARDSESSVRFAVALNPNTSPDILSILARDSESSVRRRVVFNPNTSSKILRELLNDRDNDVINSAKNRLKNK